MSTKYEDQKKVMLRSWDV